MANVKKGNLTKSPQWWKHLKDWKKMALIDGAIAASEDKGDEGVTDSFVTYIAKKTGISKSNIIKKLVHFVKLVIFLNVPKHHYKDG